MITLANAVAEAVDKKYPGKIIGVYAYGFHSPPPTIKVHPNVVVSIATAFIQDGYSVDELLNGWSQKASRLGIREYYGVNVWDRDLPGAARGGDLGYLEKTIPEFYSKNVKFMTAESSDNWGPNGLGYYLSARFLWDVDEVKRADELEADFLDKAFGTARAPMAEFYRLIDGSRKPLLSPDLLGRMYGQLDKALTATNDPAVRARLSDLVLYTRYVELYSQYDQAAGAKRQAAFEAVLRYAWRIRRTEMVHTQALWRDLKNRDKAVKMPQEVAYNTVEADDPWKSSEPFSPAQIQDFIRDGIKNNPTISFEAVSFSRDLVPATALKLSSGKPGSYEMVRGSTDFWTWLPAPGTLALQTTAGLVYQNKGAADITLFPANELEGKSVASAEVQPDKAEHPIQLKSEFAGAHRINVDDSRGGTALSWPAGTPMVLESSLQQAPTFAGGRWSLYFYVPKGTKIVGGYRNGLGNIVTPDGQVALSFDKAVSNNFWSVPVAPGQDGKLWMLSQINGQVKLMTVPPYLARSADEMLVPREVLNRDAGGAVKP